MTYSALARASEALAMRLLAARGVETLDGEPVAFFASRDPATIIVELAILKAGGAYVPIDRSYPPQRVAFVLEDSGACLFVKTAGDACAAPPGNLPIVAYDWRAPSEAPAEPAQRLPRRQRGDAPAYLMYTSAPPATPRGCASRSAVSCAWRVRTPTAPVRAAVERDGHAACLVARLRCVDVRDLGRAAQRRHAGLLRVVRRGSA